MKEHGFIVQKLYYVDQMIQEVSFISSIQTIHEWMKKTVRYTIFQRKDEELKTKNLSPFQTVNVLESEFDEVKLYSSLYKVLLETISKSFRADACVFLSPVTHIKYSENLNFLYFGEHLRDCCICVRNQQNDCWKTICL